MSGLMGGGKMFHILDFWVYGHIERCYLGTEFVHN